MFFANINTLGPLSEFGGFVIAAIGLIVGIGGVTAYFQKGRGDNIIKYQAIEIDERDKTIARLKEDNAALQRENDILHEQNNKLWDKAQGNPQLKKLTDVIATLTSTINANIGRGK